MNAKNPTLTAVATAIPRPPMRVSAVMTQQAEAELEVKQGRGGTAGRCRGQAVRVGSICIAFDS